MCMLTLIFFLPCSDINHVPCQYNIEEETGLEMRFTKIDLIRSQNTFYTLTRTKYLGSIYYNVYCIPINYII